MVDEALSVFWCSRAYRLNGAQRRRVVAMKCEGPKPTNGGVIFGLCVRMEEAGELARDTQPEDGRARALRLTSRGKKLAQRVDESSARHFERLTKRLGDTAPHIVLALDRLLGAMTSTEEDPCTQDR